MARILGKMDISGIVLSGVGVFILLAIVYMMWVPVHEWNIYWILNRYGVVTTAQIESFWEQWFRGRHYFVEFSLGDSFSGIRVIQEIGSQKYRVLHKGTNITVCYLPNSPRIVRLAELDQDTTVRNRTSRIVLFLMIIFPPLIFIVVVLFLLDRLLILNHKSY